MARLRRIAFLRLLKERNQKAQGYSNLNLCFNKLKRSGLHHKPRRASQRKRNFSPVETGKVRPERNNSPTKDTTREALPGITELHLVEGGQPE